VRGLFYLNRNRKNRLNQIAMMIEIWGGFLPLYYSPERA
jgi:hypothetical protein